jgi:hypothetical protein
MGSRPPADVLEILGGLLRAGHDLVAVGDAA